MLVSCDVAPVQFFLLARRSSVNPRGRRLGVAVHLFSLRRRRRLLLRPISNALFMSFAHDGRSDCATAAASTDDAHSDCPSSPLRPPLFFPRRLRKSQSFWPAPPPPSLCLLPPSLPVSPVHRTGRMAAAVLIPENDAEFVSPSPLSRRHRCSQRSSDGALSLSTLHRLDKKERGRMGE